MKSKYLYTLLIIGCLFLSEKAEGKRFESETLRRFAQELSVEKPSILIVYNFFESYINTLLPLTVEEQQKRLKEELILIDNGSLKNLELVKESSSLMISSGNKRYRVSISNGDLILLEMSFPMSCELISGMNKLEMESLFIRQLQSVKTTNEINQDDTKISNLKKTVNPNFLIKQGTNYQIPHLRSDLYYEKVKGKIQLISSPNHVIESVANIMISKYALGEYLLVLNIRKYGFKKETINIPIKDWIKYYEASGCDCYFGVEKIDGDKLYATVFVVNEEFQYNHILNFMVNTQILEERKGEIVGSINVYVPTHNVLNLFENTLKK